MTMKMKRAAFIQAMHGKEYNGHIIKVQHDRKLDGFIYIQAHPQGAYALPFTLDTLAVPDLKGDGFDKPIGLIEDNRMMSDEIIREKVGRYRALIDEQIAITEACDTFIDDLFRQ